MNTLILEQNDHGEFPVDIYQKLANDRILFICGEITDNLASDIVASLILKDAEDPEKKITLFINSEGGDIRNVFMIYDMINAISAPVETVCIGSAMDEAVILLSAGMPGMRFATKNSVIAVGQLVHDWITQANLTDAKKILDLSTLENKRMLEALAKATGKTTKQLAIDFDRKMFLTAAQSVKYGLIDKVVKFNK